MAPKHALQSASSATRVAAVDAWLDGVGKGREILVVTPHAEAGAELAARAAERQGATFGWSAMTLFQVAMAVARTSIAERGAVAMGGLAVEAVCTRVVHRLASEEALGRFTPLVRFPGLPRALARTITDVRMGAIGVESLADRDLARALGAYEEELASAALCDRAEVFLEAARLIEAGATHDLLGRPTVFVDVRIATARERALCNALIGRADRVLVTVAAGDVATEASAVAMGLSLERAPAMGPLAAVQEQLFSEEPSRRAEAAALEVLSAPGESRECVEIARRVREHALAGVRFDRMAVLLRAPYAYQAHLVEAMRRAAIPAYFARGTPTPDPSGRAMLALLACAVEGLSAARFSEFLSLGEMPTAGGDGAPPAALALEERRPPADEESIAPAAKRAEGDPADEPSTGAIDDPDSRPVVAGALRAPRHWERLIVDAVVIGGVDRWKERLASLAEQIDTKVEALEDGETALREGLLRDRAALGSLRGFAIPLLESLGQLPAEATWGEWIDCLGAIAGRALARPERVLRVLGELWPMRDVGPVDLAHARLVLEPRLGFASERATGRRQGRLFVGSTEDARGLAFDVVFVPGLAERVFPQKISQDPIFMDEARAALGSTLATNEARAEDERLALRLAMGAATQRAVVSYPRLDVEQARPRTPSFYALDLVRASEGTLPTYAEIAEKASGTAGARIGWPAPSEASRAIDEAEYDLAILERVLRLPSESTVGVARYLLKANPHLERTLRARWKRWDSKKWDKADGLVSPDPEAMKALEAHQLSARSFSPTALQNYASCPYRFLLQAVHRLAPRQEPVEIEELDPLERGSLVHETLYETLVALRAADSLPVRLGTEAQAREILERCTDAVAKKFRARLKPSFERVWDDGIASIKADLAEWLRRMPREPSEAEWHPVHFELSFGLVKDAREQQDPRSTPDPVPLDCGIQLRGSIDLVERHVASGALRATDYKTGKVRASDSTVIGGGKTLQPVMYALALEKLLPGAPDYSGRLYYCTSVGQYESYSMALEREEAQLVADTVGEALKEGFLPAAPAKGECDWCDYRAVCGPYEEERTKIKNKDKLIKLQELRRRA